MNEQIGKYRWTVVALLFFATTINYLDRQIIGFDLNEVAGLGNAWDGNVGARVLYKLANLMGKSMGRI